MARAPVILTDAQAKTILRAWPRATKLWLEKGDTSWWLRAQPKEPDKHATTPRLMVAGGEALTTYPDGMWVMVKNNLRALDVFCVEVCRNLQNFQDKRSRYASTTHALTVHFHDEWWNEKLYKTSTRLEKLGISESDLGKVNIIPIRYLRVLFVLPDQDYDNLKSNGVASGHEFFIRHRRLGQFNNQAMQKFLKRMAPVQHFLA
jgi:hypothetical protein